jgi:hypothetical protein
MEVVHSFCGFSLMVGDGALLRDVALVQDRNSPAEILLK